MELKQLVGDDEEAAEFIEDKVPFEEWELAADIIDTWDLEALKGWYINGHGSLEHFEGRFGSHFDSLADYWGERLRMSYPDVPETVWAHFDFDGFHDPYELDVYKPSDTSEEVYIYCHV